MIAGQLMFQTTSPATSASVPSPMNVSAWVTSRNSATASSSSGNHEREDHREVQRRSRSRLRQRSMPIANPTPIGTQITVVRTASTSVWITAWCRLGLWSTELTELPTYHLVEKPCQRGLRRALVEREQHRDRDRHDRPDDVEPGEALHAHGRRHGLGRRRSPDAASHAAGAATGALSSSTRHQAVLPRGSRGADRRNRSSGSAGPRAASVPARRPARSAPAQSSCPSITLPIIVVPGAPDSSWLV